MKGCSRSLTLKKRMLQFAHKLDNLSAKSKKPSPTEAPTSRNGPDGKLDLGKLGTGIRSGSLPAIHPITRGARSVAARARIREFCGGPAVGLCSQCIHTGVRRECEFLETPGGGGGRGHPRTGHHCRIRIVGRAVDDTVPVLRVAPDLRREDYPHIDTRKTLRSLACIPLIDRENLIGALEILAFEEANSRRPSGTASRGGSGGRGAVLGASV